MAKYTIEIDDNLVLFYKQNFGDINTNFELVLAMMLELLREILTVAR